ncbi:MAG: hypothetical protein V1494_06990 [Candidatus Diapherotrites archaeon]
MELSDFVGKPCKSRTAFEFIPKKKQSLDLQAVAKKMHANGVYLELDSPYLVMAKIDGANVSLFKSGKIVVKEIREEKKARETAEKLIGKMK